MVRLSYQNIANSYYEVKQAACGRQACSVMIMVAYEVDAMASCKMLTQLLRSDNIAYTIRPVLNFDEVVHNFQSFLTEDIKSIFMVNCGALYNIPKIFDLEAGGDYRVFILDNHRPLHLANIYSKHSVVVFDDTFDPSGEYDVDSLPSEGSDLSGGLSSSESEHSSNEEEEDEDMFDEELQEGDIDAAFGEDGEEGEEEEAELDDAEGDNEDQNENEDGNEEDGEDGDVEDNPDQAAEEAEDVDDQSQHSQQSEDSQGESLHSETRSVDSGDAAGDSDIDATEEGSSPLKRKLAKGKSSSKGKKVRSIVDSGDEGEEEEARDEEQEQENKEQENEEEEEEEEENVRIRGGRKRRSKEAEEAFRLKERRHALQAYYTKNATYTAPTALMLIELLSTQLGSRQMPTDVVWQAVLGVTYQYNAGHLPEGLYKDYVHFLKSQFGDALRTGSEKNVFSVRANDDTTPAVLDAPVSTDDDLMMVPGSENGYVEEASEYRFFLYRHWSLYDAMFHSPYVAAKLNVWNQQGTAKLQELLAKMGVPLQQCRQSYQYMTPALRSHFSTQMNDESVLQMYNLVNPGVTFKSFYRYNSFKNPVAASDIVHAATALTELYGVSSVVNSATNGGVIGDNETADPSTTSTTTATAATTAVSSKVTSIDAFYDAYYCLGMRSDPLMQKGIQAALDLQRTIVKKASAMLDGHSTIHRSHRLYYAYLSKTSSSWGPGTSAGSVNANSGAHASNNSSSNTNANSSANNGSADIEHSFGRPMVLAKLGQYIMDIKRNTPKKLDGWTGSALLPFVLLSEKSDGTFLVVGISPFSSVCGGEALTEEQERKLLPLTNFRQFFKLAGQLLGAPVKHISFDANVVEVRKEDVQEFLGALDDSLRKATPKHNSAN